MIDLNSSLIMIKRWLISWDLDKNSKGDQAGDSKKNLFHTAPPKRRFGGVNGSHCSTKPAGVSGGGEKSWWRSKWGWLIWPTSLAPVAWSPCWLPCTWCCGWWVWCEVGGGEIFSGLRWISAEKAWRPEFIGGPLPLEAGSGETWGGEDVPPLKEVEAGDKQVWSLTLILYSVFEFYNH